MRHLHQRWRCRPATARSSTHQSAPPRVCATATGATKRPRAITVCGHTLQTIRPTPHSLPAPAQPKRRAGKISPRICAAATSTSGGAATGLTAWGRHRSRAPINFLQVAPDSGASAMGHVRLHETAQSAAVRGCARAPSRTQPPGQVWCSQSAPRCGSATGSMRQTQRGHSTAANVPRVQSAGPACADAQECRCDTSTPPK